MLPLSCTEIKQTDCLGDSRLTMSTNFTAITSVISNIRTRFSPAPVWSVALNSLNNIAGTECIGDSLSKINYNISLLKDSILELRTKTTAFSSVIPVDLEEVAQINALECIGDSREKINYFTCLLVDATKQADAII